MKNWALESAYYSCLFPQQYCTPPGFHFPSGACDRVVFIKLSGLLSQCLRSFHFLVPASLSTLRILTICGSSCERMNTLILCFFSQKYMWPDLCGLSPKVPVAASALHQQTDWQVPLLSQQLAILTIRSGKELSVTAPQLTALVWVGFEHTTARRDWLEWLRRAWTTIFSN